MTEICFEKSLVNTLWLQLNQKTEIFAEMARKNKIPFKIPLQRHRGGVPEGSIRNSSLTKDMGNRGKKYSTKTTAQQLVEALNSKVKISTKETFFNMSFPLMIPKEDQRNVHP